MDLQATLTKLFGKGIERSHLFISWHLSELKTFTADELRELHKTATFFAASNKVLASTLKKRLGAEWYRRNKARTKRPKIKINKSKGKKK